MPVGQCRQGSNPFSDTWPDGHISAKKNVRIRPEEQTKFNINCTFTFALVDTISSSSCCSFSSWADFTMIRSLRFLVQSSLASGARL